MNNWRAVMIGVKREMASTDAIMITVMGEYIVIDAITLSL